MFAAPAEPACPEWCANQNCGESGSGSCCQVALELCAACTPCGGHTPPGGSLALGSRCLPSWKFDANVTREVGTGSAPDGDEDALLGMIVMLLATEEEPPKPEWWDEVALWAWQSCRAFLEHNTMAHPSRLASNGLPLRVVKLGSCWGGWDCVNPSYFAPAHYRVFRDFLRARPPKLKREVSGTRGFGDGFTLMTAEAVMAAEAVEAAMAAEAATAALSGAWDALIETSYMVLAEAQCESTGLVPNWFVPSQGDLTAEQQEEKRSQWPGWLPGHASCSGR